MNPFTISKRRTTAHQRVADVYCNTNEKRYLFFVRFINISVLWANEKSGEQRVACVNRWPIKIYTSNAEKYDAICILIWSIFVPFSALFGLLQLMVPGP